MRNNCLKGHLVWTGAAAQKESHDASLGLRTWLHEGHHKLVNVIYEKVQCGVLVQTLPKATSKSGLPDTHEPLALRHFQVSADMLKHLVQPRETS